MISLRRSPLPRGAWTNVLTWFWMILLHLSRRSRSQPFGRTEFRFQRASLSMHGAVAMAPFFWLPNHAATTDAQVCYHISASISRVYASLLLFSHSRRTFVVHMMLARSPITKFRYDIIFCIFSWFSRRLSHVGAYSHQLYGVWCVSCFLLSCLFSVLAHVTHMWCTTRISHENPYGNCGNLTHSPPSDICLRGLLLKKFRFFLLRPKIMFETKKFIQ